MKVWHPHCRVAINRVSLPLIIHILVHLRIVKCLPSSYIIAAVINGKVSGIDARKWKVRVEQKIV